MFLLDTNVWLELLLDQEHASHVRRLFNHVPPAELALTEFSLYSIGIILTRLKKDALFKDFVDDILNIGGVQCVRLEPHELVSLLDARARHGLDFDDAYQYAVAELHGMTLVSFDAHFDGTPLGRRSPMQVTTTEKP